MPWIAPNVGVVTNRGDFHCASCAEELGSTGVPVSGDQWFSDEDACRVCGVIPQHIPTSQYIHVSK